MALLMPWLAGIQAPAAADAERVRAHIDDLTKPRGSLGRLEELAEQIALIYGDPPPSLERRCVVVFVADHGVADAGVSAYPQQVTAQMCAVLASRRAAINVMARACGAEVVAVDVGVNHPTPFPGLEHRRIRDGSRNLAIGPALTSAEVDAAISTGYDAVTERLASFDVFALGELGIGNSTTAAAVTAALLGVDAQRVCGRGTGVDHNGVRQKQAIVAAAIQRIDPSAPIQTILAEVGGLEICALAGAVLACAQHQRAVVTDGFIATAGVLAAAALCPDVLGYVFASHLSPEPGHAIQLQQLGLHPLFDLGLRLGEGTGAVLALPILAAAAALLREMATFSGAGVSTSRQVSP